MCDFASSFLRFHERYANYFITATRSAVSQSKSYLSGLLQAVRKNIERMTEVVPDTEYQSMQHFISHSPWEHQPVINQVAKDCDRLFDDSPDTALIIDESSMPKKGKKSVGVARQWSGRLGKVDNCQVGVFAALAFGKYVSLIDERLYLPKEWIDDKKRCKAAGVPEKTEFKTKSELAFEMILHQRASGIRFAWTGLDGGYGKEPQLLSDLDDAQEIFLADVHKDQLLYIEDPSPYVPKKTNLKGRTPTKLVATTEAIQVDKWVAQQPEEAWQRLAIRDTSKGKLLADILTRRVWIWNKNESIARLWHLIVRREIGSTETIKYSLSNAQHDTAAERLAYMQGQRFFIERSFQDAKSNAGMDHYQVRSWQSWHHHMSLVMMTMLYMLETKINHQETIPLLSSADIANLLSHFLPRRDVTHEEVLRQMEVRHRQRKASIDSAFARQEALANVTK